jgi:L-alanine-DL-glutamate epimerase-like enolase superfamily enzyme
VVEVQTDAGIVGYGEFCPLGSTYLPAFAEGARTGIAKLAPSLIGADPTQLSAMNELMDRELLGHPYVKSPIDMACWDILGKASGLPLCILMGGRFGKDVPLYRAISQGRPSEMAQKVASYSREGYRKFQLKVGGDVDDDIERIRAVSKTLGEGEVFIADANTGWRTHEALRVLESTNDVQYYVEQPCKTYEECLAVRSRTNHPFILDEVIDGVLPLLRSFQDFGADVVNLKISKLGGLTRTKQVRDLCVTLGIPMTIEDTWGSDIGTAAIAHLAHSTPPRFLFSTTDFNSYVTVKTAHGGPVRRSGRFAAPTGPGLGIKPVKEVLGRPIGEYRS